MNLTDLKFSPDRLRRNWAYPLSALAYFLLYFTLDKAYYLSLVLALVLAAATACFLPPIRELLGGGSLWRKLYAALAAAGVCSAGQAEFYRIWSGSSKLLRLADKLPFRVDLPFWAGVILAAAGFGFVFLWTLLVTDALAERFKKLDLFSDLTGGETLACCMVTGFLLSLMVFAFSKSQAFYATDYNYDVIYTGDSPALLKVNAYLTLNHVENDLRQPLFALFAAPFMGIPYLIGRPVSPAVTAMLCCGVQIVMMMVANLMLCRALELRSGARLWMLLPWCCSYTTLLFSLMMEQYIVAYFWLMLLVCAVVRREEPEAWLVWGAGGSMLTSLILAPAASPEPIWKDIKSWFVSMCKAGFGFLGLLLAFCRFDALYNFRDWYDSISRFTGEALPMSDKLCQYTAFVRSCFAAPRAGIDHVFTDHVSWQQADVRALSVVGTVLLGLVLVSAVINRKNSGCRMAAFWVLFSLVMLLVLGWGTRENGLILYSLYFGWAFMALLFKLAEVLAEKTGKSFVLPLISAGVSILLLALNLPQLIRLIRFAAGYYPA